MPRPLAPRFDRLQILARRFPGIDPQSLATAIALLRFSSSLYNALDAQYARHGIARGRALTWVSEKAGGTRIARRAGDSQEDSGKELRNGIGNASQDRPRRNSSRS